MYKAIYHLISYSNDWIHDVESRFNFKCKEERAPLFLHSIVQNFEKNIEEGSLGEKKLNSLAKKIKILSEERLDYYQSSKFGFVKEFFSILFNFWYTGKFVSSAQFGCELSHQVLQKKIEEKELSIETSHEEETIEEEEESFFLDLFQEDKVSEVLSEQEEVREEKKEEIIENEEITLVLEGIKIPKIEEEERKPKELEFLEESSEEKLPEDILKVEEEEEDLTEESLDSLSFAENKIEEIKEKVEKMAVPLTPKEEMLETFYTTWKHADDYPRMMIQQIWGILMIEAEVVSWKQIGKSSKYALTLKKEVTGTHPQMKIPLSKFVLKQKMTVAFSEIKNPKTDQYQQRIDFVDQGLCLRIGAGWFAKDSPIDFISLEEYEGGSLKCTMEGMGQKIVKSADFLLTFWSQANWE